MPLVGGREPTQFDADSSEDRPSIAAIQSEERSKLRLCGRVYPSCRQGQDYAAWFRASNAMVRY